MRLPGSAEQRDEWPRVSVIVAACDEASGIEAATRAKLASDYPNLEVVLVEDRSRDETPAIADRLAREEPRLRVVHVKELPPGWLGKVHAMHVGQASATGEWLLFSDADVHFEPDLLRRFMQAVLEADLEFATTLPEVRPSGFILDVLLSTLLRLLVAGGRFHAVRDPRSRAAVGGGVFNLVKRSALERTKGFEWLRMEIADDMALGQMLKDAGAREAVVDGSSGIHLHFYRSVAEMMRGAEKNGYAVFGALRPLQLLATVGLVLYLELGAALALLAPTPANLALSAVAMGTLGLTQVLVARASRRPLGSALVLGLGALCMVIFALRSAFLTHSRGGVVWRGTLYPLAELRAGRRMRLF